MLEIVYILKQIDLRTSGMEKQYQGFISSTFQDLKGARQEVSQA